MIAVLFFPSSVCSSKWLSSSSLVGIGFSPAGCSAGTRQNPGAEEAITTGTVWIPAG